MVEQIWQQMTKAEPRLLFLPKESKMRLKAIIYDVIRELSQPPVIQVQSARHN